MNVSIKFWFFIQKGLCLKTLFGHTGWVYTLTLLPNGLLASGACDSSIFVWDMIKTYPQFTLAGHTECVRALVVINDKLLASGSQDRTIKLWSLSSFSLVKSWTASTSQLYSLAYDSTLNLLASGGNTTLVTVWNSSLWNNISDTGKIYFSFEQ